LPGKATIRPSDEKQVSTKPPPPLAGVSEIACLCFTFSCSRMMITLSGGHFIRQSSRRKAWAFSAQRTKIFPREHRAKRNTLEGFSSILDTVGALANQRQKLRASFFLIAEYALDGETGGAATEAQILQRNESRDIHMPRGALNTEGPKNQNPRPFAQTARDKDGVPGLLSFTSWAATPAAQDLRGGSTQRAGRSVHRYVR